MNVPFLDVGAAYGELRAEIDAAVARVLASGRYVAGPEVAAFEGDFAEYCGARHCVGTGNGLDALRLALLAVGVAPGDEVIVAGNTFIATWLAVSQIGAVPVPVEPDPATYNLDPARVEAAITERTRALLPTHLYGQSADLDPLLELARRHRLKLVEDAAQAHGATYKGRRVGAHGDAAAWSFFPAKNLGAMGDGGAVTTDDGDVAERVRLLGNYGSREKGLHVRRGWNSRLDPLQAALLRVKLPRLDEWNARRAAIALRYSEALAGGGIEPPFVPQWADPSWHLYVVRTPQRDALGARLRELGIETLIHYPIPPHLQGAYADSGFARGTLPISERAADEVLSLPIGPHLSLGEVDRVIEALRAAAR